MAKHRPFEEILQVLPVPFDLLYEFLPGELRLVFVVHPVACDLHIPVDLPRLFLFQNEVLHHPFSGSFLVAKP